MKLKSKTIKQVFIDLVPLHKLIYYCITIISSHTLIVSCDSPPIIKNEFTIGIVSDVHADMLPDIKFRMQKFLDEAKKNEADMIIQLGDFCRPNEKEQYLMDIWNNYVGDKYHVLGNHDMDFNTKEEVIEFWELPSNYYSFDKGGIHFVVLDANYLYKDGAYIDYQHANFYVKDEYRAYINPEQIEWLKKDLEQTEKKTIIFSHQSLINVMWGIKNRIEIQQILENINTVAGFQKVIACFNGHDHIDFHREINGINYFEINSLGYQWMGSGYGDSTCYNKKDLQNYPHLDKVAIYQDPLYAFVTISEDQLIVQGVKSNWRCISPAEKGIPEMVYGNRYSPSISNYKVNLY